MAGVRSNQLIGYGLVVGLDGTGDQTTQTPFTTQSLNSMLQQLGVTVPPGTTLQLRNVAAVMVTAQLPPFAAAGADDRRQRLVDRQCQEPARRHADRHAAEGRRRPDLRAGPGQPDRRRRRRLGRRLQGADQPPVGRAACRTARPSSAPCPTPLLQGDSLQLAHERHRLPDRARRGPGHQRGQGRRARPRAVDGRMVRVQHAGRAGRARGLPGRHREPAGRSWRSRRRR